MPGTESLRALVTQRLTAAAEDILELFFSVIAEYEETVAKQKKQLEAYAKSGVRRRRAGVQQLSALKGEQDWSPLPGEAPPEPLYVKEEQKELQICWEGKYLRGLEEADAPRVADNPVAVESEEGNDPESPQCHESPAEGNSHTEHLKNDIEECAEGPTVRHSEDDTEDSSDYDTDDSDCVTMSKRLRKTFRCSECGKQFRQNGKLKIHMSVHMREKIFSCSVCSRRFVQKEQLTNHMAHGCQSSWLHQRQTDKNRGADSGGEDDRGGSEPVQDKSSHAVQQETDDSDDWEETETPQFVLRPLQSTEASIKYSSIVKDDSGNSSVTSSECPTTSAQIPTKGKQSSFSVRGKKCKQNKSMEFHMKLHSKGKLG